MTPEERTARKVLYELELYGQSWATWHPGDAWRVCIAIAVSIGIFARGRR